MLITVGITQVAPCFPNIIDIYPIYVPIITDAIAHFILVKLRLNFSAIGQGGYKFRIIVCSHQSRSGG